MGVINHLDGHNKKKDNNNDDILLLFLLTFLIIFIMVTIGTLGYRVFGNLKWIDAFHNGAMVFTSTSLIVPVETYHGKIFSAFYNILSGIFVLVIIGVVVRRGLVAAGISSEPSSSNNNNNYNHDRKKCKCCQMENKRNK